MKCFVFAAHPDDEIGCAGTLIKLRKRGILLNLIVLSLGELSSKKQLVSNMAEKRKIESLEASKIIGFDNVEFLNLKNLDFKRNLNTLLELVKIIRRYKPDICFIPYMEDYHYDHREGGRMVKEAIRMADLEWLQEDLGERHMIPMVLEYTTIDMLEPHIIVDIEAEFAEKMEAMKKYESQITARYFQLMESLNGYWGYLIRSKYGEGFRIPSGLHINMQIMDILK
ncbi:MAG: PIG-L family deacetylase [Candidatus Aenigmarchaeota archaeon]|nr:PIG-L family deacetylase [Candidatus Aenigmarchaeota archaeon]